MSARVAAVVGNLSVISQCLAQLNLYQPWARGFETAFVDRKDEIQRDFAQWSKPLASMMTALKDQKLIHMVKLGDISDRRFFYPSDKRRTRENTEALRQAERNLDDFWVAIGKVLYTECGNLDGTAARRLLSQQRILQRTAEWVGSLNTAGKN